MSLKNSHGTLFTEKMQEEATGILGGLRKMDTLLTFISKDFFRKFLLELIFTRLIGSKTKFHGDCKQVLRG
jgi:hypothetical protein